LIQLHASFIKSLLGSVRDLTPVILVIVFFQLVVLEQPFPDVVQLVQGIVLVLLGLTLFIMGLELALFPIGDSLAKSLVSFGSLFWLIVFAFALGFGTTIAEPALIAIADEAAKVAANSGAIALSDVSRQEYATGLRLSVALAVGIAVVLGVVRIIRGWPIHYLIIGGYIMVVILTLFAPQEIIGIAYDSGGVTTSTVTVPLVTALGVGLSHAIKGRSPLYDGFGLIALASLFPMIFVMAYGIIIA
jgi:hypothetical protein